METKKPSKLAICGKVISVDKIGEKSLAQFKSQLKLAGVEADAAYIEHVYNAIGGRDAARKKQSN